MARIFARPARQTQRGMPATTTHSRPRITPAIAARDIQTTITAFQNIQSFSLYAGAVLGADDCSTTLAVTCTDSISCTLYPTAFILTENPTTMSWTYIYPFNGTPWSYAAACTNFQDDTLPIQGECYDITTIGYGLSAYTVSTSNFPISFVTDYLAPLPITSGAELLPSGGAACTGSGSSLPPSVSPVPGTIYTSGLPSGPTSTGSTDSTGSTGSTNSPTGVSTSPFTTTGVSSSPDLSLQNIATTDPVETQSRIRLGGSATPSPNSHSGLSKGGVIGVAVAVPVGVIAIAVAAGILLWKRRKAAKAGGGGFGMSSVKGGEGATQGVTEIQNVGPYHR